MYTGADEFGCGQRVIIVIIIMRVLYTDVQVGFAHGPRSQSQSQWHSRAVQPEALRNCTEVTSGVPSREALKRNCVDFLWVRQNHQPQD